MSPTDMQGCGIARDAGLRPAIARGSAACGLGLAILFWTGGFRAQTSEHAGHPAVRLAILDLAAEEGVPRSLATYATSVLTSQIVGTRSLTVVERRSIHLVLKEQALQRSGCTDSECAVRVGKLLAANKVLIGTLSRVGSDYAIAGRIVDVEKGTVERAANARLSSTKLEAGLKRIALQLIGRPSDDPKREHSVSAVTVVVPKPGSCRPAAEMPVRNLRVEPFGPRGVRLSWELATENRSVLYVGRWSRPIKGYEQVAESDNLTSPPLSARSTSFVDPRPAVGRNYYVVVTPEQMRGRGGRLTVDGCNSTLRPIVVR